MKRRSASLSISLPLFCTLILHPAICAASIPPVHLVLGQKANERSLAKLLRERRLEEATRFLVYFEKPNASQAELFAQYYLMTCQPKAAAQAIEKIKNDSEQALFKAVLFAMVSIDRPTASGPKVGSKSATQSTVQIKYKIDRGEIWKDEWKELKSPVTTCEKMPVIPNIQARDAALKRSRELFEALPISMLTRDFSIVTLALEVGTNLKHREKLLEYYRPYHASPFYHRLLASDLEGSPQDASHVRTATTTQNEIQFEKLTLEANEYKPTVLTIPFLLAEEPQS